tara:strand:+ start:6390 stop:7268 length:879 start_codon:yes stop_codon:yes gene_type:complete
MEPQSKSYAPPPAPIMEESSDYAMADVRASEPQIGGNGTSELPQRAGRFLAYTHNRTISVPTDDLKALLDQHTKICMDAGPQNCLVTNSNVNGLGTEYANGHLSLKAAPDWALPFLDGLPEALSDADATVSASSTSATDLTSQIIDTDAQLTALKTLRGRLQTLLENRDGDLSELLSVERELARVQGQVDSYEANLANLRQRVAMSDVYLNYEAKVSPVSQSVWRPLTSAFDDFFEGVAEALGGIVRILPFLIVWIPLLAGLFWIGLLIKRALLKKRDTAKPSKAKEKPDAA